MQGGLQAGVHTRHGTASRGSYEDGNGRGDIVNVLHRGRLQHNNQPATNDISRTININSTFLAEIKLQSCIFYIFINSAYLAHRGTAHPSKTLSGNPIAFDCFLYCEIALGLPF